MSRDRSGARLPAAAAAGAAVLLAAAVAVAVTLLVLRRPADGGKDGPADPAAEGIEIIEATVMKDSSFVAKGCFPGRSRAEARAVLERSVEAARRTERLMSRFLPDSDVSHLSAATAGQAVQVDPWTFSALETSVDLWRRSGGAFDITVGPLIGLYKYTRKEEREPTDQEIAAARRLLGCDKLVLDRRTSAAWLSTPGMTVDLSAVAQGFSVDRAAEELERGGAAAGLVEIGGEVRAFGRKPDGKPWRVGVRHPRAERLMADMELDGLSVSTSGDYEKFFMKGGRRASHILDPRTGRPLVGGAVSVTVICRECELADGLATAMSVLGPEEGLRLAESYRAEGRAVEALIVEETADGKLVPHLSPGLKELEVRL